MTIKGYEFKTDLWELFTEAESKGVSEVKKLFKEKFEQLKKEHNVIGLTELVITTNWKCWDNFYTKEMKLSKTFSDLYYKAHNWCCSNFKGEDMDYYFKYTD